MPPYSDCYLDQGETGKLWHRFSFYLSLLSHSHLLFLLWVVNDMPRPARRGFFYVFGKWDDLVSLTFF
jgi:hypothetical protein